MLVDFTRVLRTLRGEPMQMRMADGKISGSSIGDEVAAIIAVLPTDRGMSGSMRRKRFDLSIRIMRATEPIDLTLEEVTLITNEIDKTEMAPVVYGQILSALEGSPDPIPAPASQTDASLAERAPDKNSSQSYLKAVN